MKNQDAKFILGAFRPDGQDAEDATFQEPLAQAKSDPELQAWLEKERKADRALARKLEQIAPPPGLKEAIYSGARASASKSQRSRWLSAPWLAAAAAVILLAAFGLGRMFRNSAAPTTASELAALALQDLVESGKTHTGHTPALSAEQAALENVSVPFSAASQKLNLADLQAKGCRTVTLAGHTVFELCFERDGTWYHLYAGRRGDFAPEPIDSHGVLSLQGALASTVWAADDRIFALVTTGGVEALHRLI